MRGWIAAVVVAGVLTGCSSDDDSKDAAEPEQTDQSETSDSASSDSASPAIEKDARYGTVEALRDAAVSAG